MGKVFECRAEAFEVALWDEDRSAAEVSRQVGACGPGVWFR